MIIKKHYKTVVTLRFPIFPANIIKTMSAAKTLLRAIKRDCIEMDISEYLEKKGLGYEHLSEDERKAISNFSLMWSLFEAQLLEENASSKKIISKCKEWKEANGIDQQLINDHLAYFQDRYIENGEPNYRYKHLHLRKNDQPDLILGVLKGEVDDIASKMVCCLIIILRFRNNYFHGIKWAYQFADQKENFDHSCNLLAGCLDRYAH